jgi:UDP-2,3-diacylglucosamine pyrophosphatase LpxH
VSDLHLCDVEEHRDGWKYFKSSRYHVDRPLADLVDHFVAEAEEGDENVLVLNGDVFDFDLVTAVPKEPPWPLSWRERRFGLAPTAAKSVWKLNRVLDCHPLFVETLAGFLEGGGRIVYVLGNHDREACFPAVQQAFRQALAGCLLQRGVMWQGEGLEFEPWFFLVPGALYVEHGNQYDPFTAFRDVLRPTIIDGGQEQLALPMGNQSNRCLLSRVGRFNPFSGDYIRSWVSYMTHWFRHYFFSRRSLVLNWIVGAVIAFISLMRTRHLESRQHGGPRERRAGGGLGRIAMAKGLTVDQLQALQRLHVPPVYQRVFQVVRQLWLDRLALWLGVAVAYVGLLSWGLFAASFTWWVKLGAPVVLFPLFHLLYERLASRETIFDMRDRMPEYATEIARLVGVKLVTFGHDHVPKAMPLRHGTYFADSGTWAPITEVDRSLAPGYRNYLIVVVSEGRTSMCFDSWPLSPGATSVATVFDRECTDVPAVGSVSRAC